MSCAGGPDLIQDGLVLHLDAADRKSYPGSGTIWTDRSGFGNNGTLTNGPTFSAANGGSIVFDGVDDYINCGILGNFGSEMATKGLTFDIIFKTTYIADFKQFGTINSGSNTLLAINFNRDANDNYVAKKTAFNIRSEGGTDLLGCINYDIYTGNFFNLIITRLASSNSLNFYVNGMPLITEYGSYRNNPTTFSNFQYPFILGAINNRNTITRHFDSSIASFKLYNKALSASEILQNYNSQKSRFNLR